MKHPYGYFNESGTEFHVTNPETPRAFDNFLWNRSLFSNVQQTGVGYCDYQIGDREAVQLLTGNGRVCDFDIFGRDSLMSRLLYIRDNETAEYWNVNWEPVRAPYDHYECIHGMGYTRIETSVKKIGASYRIFVPAGQDPVELWSLTVRNEGETARNLSIFIYNQFQFRYKWGFDSYGDMLFRSSEYRREDNAVVASKHPHVRPHDYLVGFLTSDMPMTAWDGTRSAFVGTYGTLREPKAVVEGHCSNTPGSSDATIGAAQYDILLEPGEEKALSLILGVTDHPEHIREVRDRYLGKFEQYFHALQNEKQTMADAFTVQTPDAHLNRMFNYWVKEQAMFGAAWCRWGWNGYRDIVQHGFGVSSIDPNRSREILLEAVQYQYASGLALRGWNPVDTKAYSDSALWLVFTLVHYLRETDDQSILWQSVPFYDGGEATLLVHIERALNFLEEHKGAHGLCLIKYGDWNDSLTAVGKDGRGESVWLTEAYGEALQRMAGLMDHLGDDSKAAEYRSRFENVKTAVNESSWDGAWYVRCFDDEGAAVGSSRCREGKIFSESQAWALIAGIATPERAQVLLDSCVEQLQTPQGFKLLAPTFTQLDDHVGRISSMEPGICENGTIYSHINIWLILGMIRYGRPEEAYDAFCRFTAGYLEGEANHKHLNPPYIYANCYYGPDHKNSAWLMEFAWITGSISWILNVMMNDFLGILPDYDGLLIQPCIPRYWKEYRVVRRFRGAKYQIMVKNPDGQHEGVVSLTVDGKTVKGNKVPLFEEGFHTVIAQLGRYEDNSNVLSGR